MLITEFPEKLSINSEEFILKNKDPRKGMVFQEKDDHNILTYMYLLISALEQCLLEATTCFLTIGNDPGNTVGIKKTVISSL